MNTTYPIILTGPTGSGKTATVLELARMLPIRVISADSMQVYRRLDIGTAKPSAAEQAAVRHYGIDLLEPDRIYSVAEWVGAAVAGIQETLDAGEWPVITGGARLYLQALVSPFNAGPAPDPALRLRLEAEAAAAGSPLLHRRLAEVDPAAADRLHPNDLKRVMRALEVYHTRHAPLSELQSASQREAPLIAARWFAVTGDRDHLYRRVEDRTEAMMEAGWIDEVKSLLEEGYGPELEAIKAHGYREIAAYLSGNRSLPAVKSAVNQNVRNFVRYQLGWIRQLSEVVVLDAGLGSARNANRMYQKIVTNE